MTTWLWASHTLSMNWLKAWTVPATFEDQVMSVKCLAYSRWSVNMPVAAHCPSASRNVCHVHTQMRPVRGFSPYHGVPGAAVTHPHPYVLTAAAAMPAVCAAMPVPFLAFLNPSVPQEVRARGWLAAETTWICVLGEQGGTGGKMDGSGTLESASLRPYKPEGESKSATFPLNLTSKVLFELLQEAPRRVRINPQTSHKESSVMD